jgi:hypothetical protein
MEDLGVANDFVAQNMCVRSVCHARLLPVRGGDLPVFRPRRFWLGTDEINLDHIERTGSRIGLAD